MTGAFACVQFFAFDGKWAFMALVVFVMSLAVAVLRPAERHWLFLYCMSFSITLNIYPFYLPHFYSHPVAGIPISFYDIPLSALFIGMMWKKFIVKRSNPIPKRYILPFMLVLVTSFISSFRAGETPPMLIAMCWAQLKCFILFFVLSSMIDSPEKMKVAVAGLCTAVALHSLVAFMQVFSGQSLGLSILGEARQVLTATDAGIVRRVGGLIGTENLFSKYLGMHLPLIGALFFAPVNKRLKRYVLIPLFIAGCGADIITYCRGGWISLAFGLMLMLSLCCFKRTGRRLSLLCGPFLVGIVIATVLAGIPTTYARLSKIEFGSGPTRVKQYEIAVSIIKKNPVFGIGLGRFVPVHADHDYSGTAVSRGFSRPVHNEYLLMASEMGLIVFAVYITIIVVTIIIALRTGMRTPGLTGYISVGMGCGLATFGLHDMTEWSWAFTLIPLWSYLGCMRAAYLLSKRKRVKVDL